MPSPDKVYLSLEDGSAKNIYNATTTPTGTHGILDSVKKVIEHAIGEKQENQLLLSAKNGANGGAIIVSSRYVNVFQEFFNLM